MELKPEIKRWIRDVRDNDPEIKERPEKAIARVEEALPRLNKVERERNVEHLRAYTNLYYQGRHNIDVPKDVGARIQDIEKRASRLNEVDAARAIVARYGGPPTEKTIKDSLERTALSRTIGNSAGEKLRSHAVKDHAAAIAHTPRKAEKKAEIPQEGMGFGI